MAPSICSLENTSVTSTLESISSIFSLLLIFCSSSSIEIRGTRSEGETLSVESDVGEDGGGETGVIGEGATDALGAQPGNAKSNNSPTAKKRQFILIPYLDKSSTSTLAQLSFTLITNCNTLFVKGINFVTRGRLSS